MVEVNDVVVEVKNVVVEVKNVVVEVKDVGIVVIFDDEWSTIYLWFVWFISAERI